MALNAWVLLAAVGALGIVRALILLSRNPASGSDTFTNSPEFALLTLVWSAATVAIAAAPFRRRRQWAWYFTVSVPIAYGALAAHGLIYGESRGPVTIVPLIAIAISLPALGAPYREFFPGELPAAAPP